MKGPLIFCVITTALCGAIWLAQGGRPGFPNAPNSPRVKHMVQQTTPECIDLENAYNRQTDAEDRRTAQRLNTFRATWDRIEASGMSREEKDAAEARLNESDDISEAKEKARSDFAFGQYLQRHKQYGCK
jgi:hypothetical protein